MLLGFKYFSQLVFSGLLSDNQLVNICVKY